MPDRLRSTLLVVLTLCAFPAPAQQPVPRWNPRASENGQLLPAFNYATVEPVLNSIGARHQRGGTDKARPVIAVTFPNGGKALLAMSSCDPEGAICKALTMQASWGRIANVPAARTAQAIERFNQRYAFSKAYLARDGRPVMQRYLTADYGFVRGNLAVNLLVFAEQSERFAAEALRPLQTSAR